VIGRTANLLSVVGLAVAYRIEQTAEPEALPTFRSALSAWAPGTSQPGRASAVSRFISAEHLRLHPTCAMCAQDGLIARGRSSRAGQAGNSQCLASVGRHRLVEPWAPATERLALPPATGAQNDLSPPPLVLVCLDGLRCRRFRRVPHADVARDPGVCVRCSSDGSLARSPTLAAWHPKSPGCTVAG
jgi:hypothetical protein